MIRLHVFEQGTLTSTEAPVACKAPGGAARTWIEVTNPEPGDFVMLVEGLGLHELALEDALAPGHPPKLEDFGEHLFLIAHTPDADDEGRTRKIAIFLAKTWIVTIVRLRVDVLDRVADRVRRNPARFLSSPDALAHAILDHMTDGFERLIDRMMDRAQDLEDSAVREPHGESLQGILDLRREVAELARVVRSQRDMAHTLAWTSHPALPKKILPYLRDVYDHLLRVYEHLDSVRETLLAAREAYLMASNNRLSEIMRTLTVIATVMMPLTVITGFFGMNFEHIPGLKTPIGFWSATLGMTALGIGMFVWFRRRGWF
jgi:magnesium transporter